MKKYAKEQEWEIRENLYISSEAYDEFWEEWKESIYETLNKNAELLEKSNVRYCFESDIDYEKEFVEQDEENEFVILLNDKGLVIYESREKKETKTKYYIHLYDYDFGGAIFESDFFESEEQALAFAKTCNFHTTENINVEIMEAEFENNDFVCGSFLRSLEPFEYGKC